MKIFFFSFLIFLNFEAQAKQVGKYHTEVKSKNVNGGLTDIATVLTGWTCTSSTSVNFTQNMLDHKGATKIVPQQVAQNSNFSLFSTRPKIAEFNHDLNTKDPNVMVHLGESCDKTSYKYVNKTCQNDQGRSYDCSDFEPRTETIHMRWNCNFKNLPTNVGDKVDLVCAPGSHSFGGFGLEGLLLSALRDRVFETTITMVGKEENITKDLCHGNMDNRVLIQLKQGAGGHMGEDDFVFLVKIDNEEPFEIKSTNGILNDDVLYCGGKDKIKVDISAKEVDLVWDDCYVPQNSANLSRSIPGNYGNIKLGRKTFFGNMVTDKNHEIAVTISDLSPQSKAGSVDKLALESK